MAAFILQSFSNIKCDNLKKNQTFLFINIVITQWILQLICEVRMEDQRWAVLTECSVFWNGLFILVYQHCYIIIITISSD